MPRNYVRKNVRALWSEEDLRNAIEDLRNGRGSVREVSRTYNVPARTLMRRMSSGNLSKEKLGRKCCLTLVHEASLVKYIQNMEKHGFAITSVDVKKLAFSFATKNNIPHNFNIDKKQAGHDWFVSFMQRHPELSIRKAQGMSIARAQGMNKDECGRYFDLLGKILTENDLVNTPRKIFNIDESGLQLNNNPGKVVATKGAKTVNCVTSGEKGETVSVIACVNAEGHFLPPVCIFKVISKTNNTSFEAIAPIPVIPGPSRCNKRKQHAELLTSPEIIAEKRNKKETKDKKEAEKLKRKQEKERKEANKNKKGTQKTKKKRNTRITDDTSSSESELEVNTVESGDSELEHDESEFCAQCGGYYFDKTGPKCDWLQCVKCHNWVHEICTPSDKHCADCV
ncbi:uncharacterized protein LOC116182439 isoform X2 [Photinus pyralis]|uniref:uncharacterized protein LOC116165140 isoform X2 n=1 Tax=Photinus pyralis TaxID=7054 RepID=UPI0012670F42|nr:uncharacterized protein LOC116165140 isoform X2 [Photinus pyralis]XP_031352293.1 uncharacterized protein LOC116177450 isoform X2 [Photinus pyralis]XP_031358835.1 uncharacterized protein LOC116182439 isoform X2 [Photinus pyralis]